MSGSHSWHEQSKEQVLADLDSSLGGLPEAESTRRQAQYGPNSLPEPPRRSLLLRFLSQFHNILIYVLLGAAVITAMLDHVVDSSVILAVVLANAVIGFLQEGRAEKAMDAIRGMLAPRAAVLRDGRRTTVEGDKLVPGDIVLLEAGDKVPADLRLLKTHGLQIQEAILTGESLAVEKQTRPVDSNAPLGDRTCMAFSGTTVTSGQATGVVVATGAATEIGRISGMLSEVEMLTTPLVEQMGVFARWLTMFIIIAAGLILAIGYWGLQQDFSELFMAVVGLSVAAIPEGLPAVLTITLAVGVQAMAKRNAIVRRLPAIETLGSVSVICSDKTGTLTRNEMAITTATSRDEQFSVHGTGYEPAGFLKKGGEEIAAGASTVMTELGQVAALCNDAELRNRQGSWDVEGDPMEGALLAFSERSGVNSTELREQWTRTDVIPFDARHRFMATLHHDHEKHAVISLKGAPEAVLKLCTQERTADGGTATLDPDAWSERAEMIAGQGQRVLALAARSVEPDHVVLERSDIEGSMVLLGLVGFIDPPRDEAIEAVAECQRAGIRVKMITGDHASTAAAIGRQIGLASPDDVMTGADLDGMDDASLAEAVLTTDVFARTSPEHKLRLVTALQAHGMTVAMTGDGVNDSPALKRADAGIAMGRKGSEAAKEASDLVLADDNFASIAAAVREGRTVYDNIRKVISWTLPTNAGEAFTIILALMLGMMLPITPIQILWVNMVTAVTLGIALAFEPTEARTMLRPPRPRNQPLLDSTLLWNILKVAVLFVIGVFGAYHHAIERGYSVELARTIAMNTLVVMEIFYLFFIRNIHGTSLTWKAVRGTKVIWLAITVVVIGQFSITYLPALQAVFSTESVSFLDGLQIAGVGVALLVIVEVEKQVRLRLSQQSASGGDVV